MLKNRRFFKPDPLLVLAIVVGLAILATSVAQGQEAPAGGALRSAVYHPSVAPGPAGGGQVARARAGTIGLGATGATLDLAFREPLALRRALAAGGNYSLGRINTRGTTLYVTFATHW